MTAPKGDSMKRTVCFIIIISVLALLASCGPANEAETEEQTSVYVLSDTVPPETDPASDTSSLPPTDSDPDDGMSETYADGITFKYPETWSDKVTAEVYEDRIEYKYGDIPLFDILIDSEEGDLVGTVKGDIYRTISVVVHEPEEPNEEVYAMQEDLNSVIDCLKNDYDFAEGKTVSELNEDLYEIESPAGYLHYPAKWKNQTVVVSDAEKVSFSTTDGVALFDIVFAECDGSLIGSYDGTPVYLVMYPVTTDEQYAMQEDVNVIIDELMKDEAFARAGA